MHIMTVYCSFELLLASDVGMFRGRKEGQFLCQYTGTLALYHLADKAEGVALEAYGRVTGSLEDDRICGSLQLEQSVARPVMRLGRKLRCVEDESHHIGQFVGHALRTADICLRGKTSVFRRLAGKMGLHNGILAWPVVALMGGYECTAYIDFHQRPGVGHMGSLAYMLVWHRVVVLVASEVDAAVGWYACQQESLSERPSLPSCSACSGNGTESAHSGCRDVL